MREVWVVFSLVALAGCAGDGGASDAQPAADDGLQATRTTGIIRGIVVDQAIVPVAQAQVKLVSQEARALTDEDGRFGFDGLDPGFYILEVTKPDFFPMQAKATVVAGDDQPSLVNVQLQRDDATVAWAKTAQVEGFVMCSTSHETICGLPYVLSCFLPTGCMQLVPDSSTPTVFFASDPWAIQSEMTWEPSQPGAAEMTFAISTVEEGCERGEYESGYLNDTWGPPPIRSIDWNDSFKDRNLHPKDCPFTYEVRPSTPPGIPVAVAVEQSFTLFVTEFHRFAPERDWWFVHDGPPVAPQ